jgi:hypothetical protein
VQKIATRIFIYASVAFGIVGILVVLTASGPGKPDSNLSQILIRLLFINVFIILPSFALSIAGKYLIGKSKTITPMAKWEWPRWINATNVQATREKRIEVSIDKLRKGMRRPCCFNRSACTQPEVSKNAMLLEPVKTMS